MGYNVSSSFNADIFARETGWEFTLRQSGDSAELTVLTPGISDAAALSAISAHDPDRLRRERDALREAAITTLSTSSVGQAVLQLLGVSSDVTTRRSR